MSDTKGASPVVTYVRAEINTKYADLLLLACCFCSGLLDSTMFNGKPPLPPSSLPHPASSSPD